MCCFSAIVHDVLVLKHMSAHQRCCFPKSKHSNSLNLLSWCNQGPTLLQCQPDAFHTLCLHSLQVMPQAHACTLTTQLVLQRLSWLCNPRLFCTSLKLSGQTLVPTFAVMHRAGLSGLKSGQCKRHPCDTNSSKPWLHFPCRNAGFNQGAESVHIINCLMCCCVP